MKKQSPTNNPAIPTGTGNANGTPAFGKGVEPPDREPDDSPEEMVATPTPPGIPRFTPRPGGSRRRLSIRLAPASVVLLLTLVVAAVYVVASGWFEGTGSAQQSTSTVTTIVATRTPAAAPAASVERPSAEPLSSEELDELLAGAWAHTLRSEFEEAVAAYQDLAYRAPDDARPEAGWAWALILDDQADQALEHARRAVELDPINADTMAVLARTYIELGDRARAVGMAEGAVQLDGSSALAHAVLAEAYLLDGRLQDAVEEAELALAQDRDNAEAHRIRGWLYDMADHDTSRAVGEFRAAAELQPELWLRHYELGLLSLKAEEYNAAIMALKKALGLRQKAIAYTALGEARYRQGEYDQARSFLQQALSAGARDADTYALLAAIDARQDRCDDATTYVEQALAENPAHPLALEARNTCEGNPAPTPGPTTPRTQSASATAEPSPSPSLLGGRIAFPVWNEQKAKYDTYVANIDGSERHLVVEEMHQPAFSPDGRWLAVNGERNEHMNLFIVQPDGSGLKEVSEYIEDNLPSWSPDGQHLVFGSTRHRDRQSRVYIIDQVPFEGEKAQGRALYSDLYEVLGEFPTWTPDGRIVYTGCDYTSTPAACGLFIASAEPGPQTPEQLTLHTQDTAPAAYGDRIAFMSNRDGNWEIYVVKDDGSGLERLTNNTANDGLPTWSPDGETLAFVSDQGGVWAVWAMNPDGSNRRKLFDIGGGGLPVDWQHERISWTT